MRLRRHPGRDPLPAAPDRCKRSVRDAYRCRIENKPAGASCASDGNRCTREVCDGQGRCTHPKEADGTGCGGACVALGTEASCGGRGDACAGDEVCFGGACEACLALQTQCTDAGPCCQGLACRLIGNFNQDQCCRPFGDACSTPSQFDECCSVVYAPGSGDLVSCTPDNTCGGPGASCSAGATCASSACCSGPGFGTCC